MKKHVLEGFLVVCGALFAGVALAGGTSMSGDMPMSGHMSMKGGAPMPHADHGEAGAMQSSTTLQVSGCWIRALPSPAPSAGYFVVHNNGAHAAVLTSAASPAFGMVMLHKSVESGGVSKMIMESSIPVPAGGSLTFKPGSYHAMLEQPVHKLVVGSTLGLELRFASGEVARATCLVRPAGALSR
ncbi:MAG TPA: copper chaperone PCu(A)C [Burkholderiaceae bacterium]|nr:copper chaperone PCu(A)C [Burkholderiaceae bacterium]